MTPISGYTNEIESCLSACAPHLAVVGGTPGKGTLVFFAMKLFGIFYPNPNSLFSPSL